MSAEIVQKLFASLKQLEEAIESTKASVAKFKNPNSEVESRLECYEQVLRKQKILAQGLAQSVREKNWEQVGRLVELIRGSSILIQLDSQSIISEISSGESEASAEKYSA